MGEIVHLYYSISL